MFPDQQIHQFALNLVGVLEFIHQDVLETLLVETSQLLILLQQPEGQDQQVIEIH